MTSNVTTHIKGIWAIYRHFGSSWLRIFFVFMTATLFGVVFVQTEIADAVTRGELGLTWQPWLWTLSAVYSYTIMAPFLIYCCEQWSFGKAHMLKTTAKLIVFYVPFTLMFITLMLVLRHIAHLLIEGALFPIDSLLDRYIYEFPKSVAVYIGVAFITYTKIYYDSSQKEQLHAAKLENELQAIRMQTLRSQLQPHFLFNTLNLISSTMYRDVDKADSIISRLGDLLRYSLATEQKPFVTVKEEIQVMTSYLDIAKLRFGDKLNLEINVESAAEMALLPAMLLQPLLENSVKYGIEPSDKKGQIKLLIFIRNNEVHIEITNPWLLEIQKQESFGIGLENTKSRLVLLYESKASISLEYSKDQQVILKMHIPLNMQGEHNG